MENLKEIIDKKYPKGLDYEFTKEEKTGYLIAIKDIEEALVISRVVGRSEQFYCSSEEDNKAKCETQCLGCAGLEEQVKQ